MQATICKWGNSLAIRLPRHVADQIHLSEGSTVELTIDDGALMVIPTRKKFVLAELLAGEPQRDTAEPTTEVDWGKPKGDEVW